MTTTAGKINRIVQDLAILRDDIQRLNGQVKDIIAEAESKPADSEPLECWVDWHKGKPREVFTQPLLKTVHMRQVTPQMLENEKDAARFRRLMEMDGVGWQEGGEGWTILTPGRTLREAMDKEMEDK